MKPDDLISLIRAITMCLLAVGLVGVLCGTLFYKTYADPTVLVTVVGATNLLLGYLAGKRSVPSEDSSTPTPTPTPSKPEEPKKTP